MPSEALETLPGLAARSTPETPAEDAALPDWLTGLEPEAEPPARGSLRSFGDQRYPRIVFPRPRFNANRISPARLDAGIRAGNAPESEVSPDEIPPEALETKDIPGLGFQSEEEAAEPGDLPEWLRGLAPEDELPPGLPPEPLPEQSVEAEPAAWVSEPVKEGPEPPAEALETKDIPGLSFQDQEVSPAEDVPEWLQGLDPETPAETPEPLITTGCFPSLQLKLGNRNLLPGLLNRPWTRFQTKLWKPKIFPGCPLR